MRREGIIQFRDHFLVKTKTTKANYADHPPGSFDPVESIRFGKPKFKTLVGVPQLLRKHIVLNDFDPAEWNDPALSNHVNFHALTEDQKKRLLTRLRKQYLLHELLNAGFKISVSHAGVLRKISHDDISAGFNEYVTQDSARLSSAVSHQLNLPRKKVMVLDAVEMETLLSNQKNEKMWISFSDVCGICADDARQMIALYREKENIGVAVDVFNDQAQKFFLNDSGENRKIFRSIRVNGNASSRKKLIDGTYAEAQCFDGLLGDDHSLAEHIDHVIFENLVFTNSARVARGENGDVFGRKAAVNQVVKKTKRLSLLGCQLTDDDLTQLLAGVQLEFAAFSGQLPDHFLTKTSPPVAAFAQLTEIKLNDVYARDVHLNIPSLRALSLSNLEYRDTQTIASAVSLSEATKKTIEVLQLINCSDRLWRDGSVQLNHNQFIQDLITALPHLYRLELQSTHLDPHDLPNLVALTHLLITCPSNPYEPKTFWTFEQLCALLAKTPSLKNLQFSIEKEDTLPQLEAASLPDLEKIEIIDGPINRDQLKVLLRAAPNLKELVIYNPYMDLLALNFDQDLSDQDAELAELLEQVNFRMLGKSRRFETARVMVAETTPSADQIKTTAHSEAARAPESRIKKTPHVHKKEKTLDANTKNDPEQQLDLYKIFVSKTPDNQHDYDKGVFYRLDIYDGFEVNKNPCGPHNAFTLKKNDVVDIKPSTVAPLERNQDFLPAFNRLTDGDKKHYRAEVTLKIGQAWLPLPSLSPADILTHWIAKGRNDIELGYSQTTNLYYVKKTTPGESEVDFNFIVNEPMQAKTPETIRLSPELKKLIDTCRAFEGSQIGWNLTVPVNATGSDYLQALEREKVGACRHRALYCMHAIIELNKNRSADSQIKVRYIGSDVHAFVEVKEPGQTTWVTCDLGGAECVLQCHSNDGGISETATVALQRTMQRQEQPSVRSEEVNASADGESLQDYLKMVCDTPQKYLIRVDEAESIGRLSYQLQQYCEVSKRPYFYVNSPSELVCAADYIKRLGSLRGMVCEGPGGPLYDFLTRAYEAGEKPILFVNFDDFSASDFATYNTVVDQEPSVDGVRLPERMTVVGLIHPSKPGADHDSSFYSRFGRETPICPFRADAIPLPTVVSERDSDAAIGTFFDCHDSEDWQDYLLGQWCLGENGFYFEKGALLKALENMPQPQSITIFNAPETPEFERFWNEAVLKGKIDYRGFQVSLPSNFTVKTSNEVQLHADCIVSVGQIDNPEAIPQDAFLLNHTAFQDFLFHNNFAGGRLVREDGIFKKHAGETLSVYLTDALDLHAWSWFIEECEKPEHHVKVKLFVAEGVELPDILKKRELESVVSHADAASHAISKNRYIESTDRDATVAILKQSLDQEHRLVIDISEMTSNDLLGYISGEKSDNGFVFSQKESLLETALAENGGKTVILHGTFSPALQHALTAFLLQRDRDSGSVGQLILVSESTTSLSSVCKKEMHQVTVAEKKALLRPELHGNFLNFDDARIERHSLVTLRAIVSRERVMHHKRMSARENSTPALSLSDVSQSIRDSQAPRNSAFYDPSLRQSQQHLIGLHTPPKESMPARVSSLEADLLNADCIVEAFNRKRREAVEAQLASQPFAFLAGISGVGKTTFVSHYFGDKLNQTLYVGEANIKKWAKDESIKRKILFIDEANITQKGWSEFEGLYEDPPYILFEGERITLTPGHKVIFAGNPISYSDDRQLPSFIGRHGNSVSMKTLPVAYLYHQILLPILEISINPSTLAIDVLTPIKIAKPILEVAQFLTACSKDEVLITPRELAMMALLVKSYCLEHIAADPIQVAAYYAYQLSEMFVPKDRRAEFETRFKPLWAPKRDIRLPEGASFLLTEANKPSAGVLDDFLSLRKRRVIKEAGFDSIAQQTAGLGGVLIEGEPGLGKSQLALEMLKQHGVVEEGDANAANLNPQQYYKVQSGWSDKQASNFFKKAFHAGAIVIWDEMNSSPLSMERLLNNLLMGRDDEGNTAANPGFLLIGTQNPAMMMDGRDMTSPAVLHRMHYRVLPPYAEPEMIDILCRKGLSEAVSEKLVSDHHRRKQTDKKRCFRDLVAEAEVAAQNEFVKAQHAIEAKAYLSNAPTVLSDNEVRQIGQRAKAVFVKQANVTLPQLCALAISASGVDTLEEVLQKAKQLPSDAEDVYFHLAQNKNVTPTMLVEIARNSRYENTVLSVVKHMHCDDGARKAILTHSGLPVKVLHHIGLHSDSLRKVVVETKAKQAEQAPMDLSGFDLTKIDLSKMNLKNVILAGATITASQLNYLAKFTTNFSDVTVVTDGQKIKHKKGMRLDFTGADLRGVECDEWAFYRANTFARTKVDSKQFFQMSAGGLLTHEYKKGTEQHHTIKANLPIVITDLSKLDLTRFDLSEAQITEETTIAGAKLTSKQVNQLYEKGVRAFDSVIIVNDNENTLISYAVFDNAVFTKAHIPASQIERAYQDSDENGHRPVTEFKGLIVEGSKLTLDFTSHSVSPRSESVSSAAPSVDVGKRSPSRNSGSSFQLPTEGDSPQTESPTDDRDDLEAHLLPSVAGSKTPCGESVASSRPDDGFVVEGMVCSLPRPLVLIDVDLSGVKKINFTDFTTLAALTTEEVVINAEQAASLKGKSGTASFTVKNPPVSGLKSNLFGRSKKEAVPEITVSLERPDSGGSQPR